MQENNLYHRKQKIAEKLVGMAKITLGNIMMSSSAEQTIQNTTKATNHLNKL